MADASHESTAQSGIRQVLRALFFRLSISVSYGYSLLLLSATFSLLAGWSWIVHVQRTEHFRRASRSVTERLLQQEMLPMRDEPYPVIAAAAMTVDGPRQSSSAPSYQAREKLQVCESNPEVCDFDETLHRLAADFSARLNSSGESSSATDLSLLLDALGLSGEAATSFKQAYFDLLAHPAADVSDLSPCWRQVHVEKDTHEEEFGPALCSKSDAPSGPFLLIPSRVARLAGTDNESLLLDTGISRFLDVVAPSLRKHITTHANNPRIIQAYVISAFGSLRIWSPRLSHPYRTLGTKTLWNHAKYVSERLRAGPPGTTEPGDEDVTPIYLDIATFGLVETHCTSIHAPAQSPSTSPAIRRVAGIFCTDISVTAVDREPQNPHDDSTLSSFQSWLAPPSTDNTVFRSLDVSVSIRDSQPLVTIQNGPSLESFLDGVEALEGVSRNLLADEIADKLEDHLGENRATSPPLSGVVRLDTKYGTFFYVATAASPIESPSKWEGLLLLTHPVDPSFFWLIASLALLSLALLTYALALFKKYNDNLAQKEDTILRNLQVGVIKATDDTIESGNDRAEELLGRPLPGIGLEQVDDLPRFEIADFVHSLAVLNLNGDCAERSEIDSFRARGEAGHYYLRLNDPPEGYERDTDPNWIEVRGTPVLGNLSPSRSIPQTFGILDTVPSALGKKLSQLHQAGIGRANNVKEPGGTPE